MNVESKIWEALNAIHSKYADQCRYIDGIGWKCHLWDRTSLAALFFHMGMFP